MGGTTPLPTSTTPGYGTYNATNGSTWVACGCLIEWLPVLEALLKARGLITSSIDVWQLTGGAKASGNTHSQGGAFDLLYQTTPEHVAVAREMGAPATWARKVAQGFAKDHTHGVLSGCPHNSPAAYQITAQRRGYNGLGQATSGPYAGQWGYGARDEFPAPQTYRTWTQGIAWAQAQLATINRLKEAAVALDQNDINKIVDAVLWAPTLPGQAGMGGSSVRNNIGLGAAYSKAALDLLRSIAPKVGVDVDEKALAANLLAGLAPTVRDAVLAAGQPSAVADAVVAKLGAALNPGQ